MSDKPKKKKRRHLVRKIVLTLLVLLVLAAVGYNTYSKMKAEYTTTYDGYTATTGTISNSLSFSGSLSLVDSATYTAPSAATVRQVYVAAGDTVKKDDKLMRLSSGDTISAGFDGTVNKLNYAKGDEVKAGDSLIQLADFDHLKVSVRVDEYDISDVAIGQACNISVTATGQRFTSAIETIDYISSSQGSVAYYTATVPIDATDVANVYPGMQVTVTVPKEEAANVVVLKMDALSFDQRNQAFVYMQDENGEMQSVPVTVGVSNGNYVEIVSGLKDGDTVYVEAKTEQTATGLASLFSGMMSTQQVNRPTGGGSRGNGGNWNGGSGGTAPGGGSFGGTAPGGGSR